MVMVVVTRFPTNVCIGGGQQSLELQSFAMNLCAADLKLLDRCDDFLYAGGGLHDAVSSGVDDLGDNVVLHRFVFDR